GICDAQTHIASESEIEADFPEDMQQHPVDTYRVYDFQHSQRAARLLWSGKEITSLRISHAFRGFRFRDINRRLLVQSQRVGDLFCLYGLPDDVQYTLKALEIMRPAALKMYYAYRKPPFTRITEVFPPEVLKSVNDKNIPVLVHLP